MGTYLVSMAHRVLIALLALAAMLFIVASAHAQSQGLADDDRTTIMRPEPGIPPKYKSPRGTPQHIVTPQRLDVPPPQITVPPPLYVPQTGRLLPNMPGVSGAGPGGAETSQDRALRCANQAGVYGAAAGDRNSYIGSCINQ